LTLDRLAKEGPDDFYRGEIAAEIAKDLAVNGGFITADDLADYAVNVTEPPRGTDRGLSVAAAGAPAGGLTLMQRLNSREGVGLAAHGWASTLAPLPPGQVMGWAATD